MHRFKPICENERKWKKLKETCNHVSLQNFYLFSDSENFDSVIHDDISSDYFNKFCCLPIHPVRCYYRRNTRKFLTDPKFRNADKEKIKKWISTSKFPLFLRSASYAELQLIRALRNFEQPKTQQPKTKHFARMSMVSKFFQFLSLGSGEGLKLAEYFIKVTQVWIVKLYMF